MIDSDPYLTLIASLPPHLPNLFTAKQPPISRIQLDNRLTLLEQAHQQDLLLVEDLMHWDRISIATTDAQMHFRADYTFSEIQSEFIKEIMAWRLELRTVIAALRHRYSGELAFDGQRGGWGRWSTVIEHNWHEPAFRLERVFPWLTDAENYMREGNTLALEQLILQQVWDYYGRVVSGHYFDFEAVVVYVLRWNAIDRWSRYQREAAIERFDQMVEQGLGDFRVIFT